MTICIYDQHFVTLGGGEKHIGAIAEILAEEHQIFIIHCGKFDKAAVKSRLNLNLEEITFIDLSSDKEVVEVVKNISPDIFINATHFSRLTIPGVKNIALIFFPMYVYPKPINLKEYLKYLLGKWLFKEYDNKIQFKNFDSPQFIHGCFGRWSFAYSEIIIHSKFRVVKIYYENFKNGIIKDIVKFLKLHGKLNFYFDHEKFFFYFDYNNAEPCKLELGFNTFVPAEVEKGNTDTRHLGLFIGNVELDTFSIKTKLVLKLWRSKMFKKYVTRLYIKSNCLIDQFAYKDFLKKNELLLCNSAYTNKWIHRIYGNNIESSILYPPVDVRDFHSKEKKKMIISVGRFFVGDHNKKQLELIKVFKKMYDLFPPAREYSFHLCGGTHKEDRNINYLNLCIQSAKGYPISIHANIGFNELKEMYAEAEIFWHAAGFHEDEEKSPDKFEHFGITTVEAMAAGCVPVVYGMAGQKEIVQDAFNGFQWKTEEELVRLTKKLIGNKELRSELAANARQRALNYDKDKFRLRVKNLFENVGVHIKN